MEGDGGNIVTEYFLGHSTDEQSIDALCIDAFVVLHDVLSAPTLIHNDNVKNLFAHKQIIKTGNMTKHCDGKAVDEKIDEVGLVSNHSILTGCKSIGNKSATSRSSDLLSNCTNKIGTYKCSFCFKLFRNEPSLKLHQFTHTGVDTFPCSVCDKVFLRENILKSHLLTHTNPSNRPHSCKHCSKSFRSKPELSAHEVIHAPKKPFSCELCHKTFAQKGNMKTHLLTHSGVKPYRCVFCQKGFTQRGNLQHHLLTHTNNKPFTCEVCGQSFAQKGNLKAHQSSFLLEKPFKCTICSHSFAHGRNLKNHHEKVHNLIKLPKMKW